ncbi:MAG: four helix bundle protein [Acidobacteria bacterium]|nr:four helix bundle protein [Acidobacteriota bacterium]
MNQHWNGVQDVRDAGFDPKKIKSFKHLRVWKRAMDLVVEIYHLTEGMPREEVFGLTAQIRRSVISIPSNIAEGHARSSTGAYLNHLSIALGSLAELETQMILASRLNYLPDPDLEPAMECCREIGRMLNGLRKSLQPNSGAGI